MGRPHFPRATGGTPRSRRPLSLGPAWACSCQLRLRVPCRNALVRLQSSSPAPAGVVTVLRYFALRCTWRARQRSRIARCCVDRLFGGGSRSCFHCGEATSWRVEGETPRYPPPRCGGKLARTDREVPCKPRTSTGEAGPQ